jgi:glycosidase
VRRFASGIAALAAAAVLVAAAGADGAAGPPTGAALQQLEQLPAQSSLASQRIYFVMPDRYANGTTANDTGGLTGTRDQTGLDPTDPGYYHGGDLQGLAENLGRIKALGFTALWVTPVVKQDPVENGSAAYHGYWGLDFTTVDPHLGSDQDFANLVDAAHGLGLKVYLDVVVNHTADVIQPSNGGTYSDAPFRDCHGKPFDPARYVTAKPFPCLAARFMPEVPYLAPADAHLKKPDWLNDPLNYHDRGNIDFGSCSEQCFEQGDFYGLDDLFTEKPVVEQGLATIYGSWIARFHVDGFRVDTAKHVNAAFFRLWVPQIRASARAVGIDDFPVFGEVTLNDAVDLSAFVRDRGLPQVLDFPFQDVAADYAAGASGALGLAHRLEDDDYFRTANGVDPAFTTFLGNHDLGRAAQQILSRAPSLAGSALLQHVLLGYDLLYLLRGAPAVQWGDELGFVGSGGDKAARQDLFPTQVKEWQTAQRVGGPPVGTGNPLAIADDPIEARLTELSTLRDAYPALATGASVVRYARGSALVVSRVDLASGREVVAAFNDGPAPRTVTVQTGTPATTWPVVFGGGAAKSSGTRLTLTIPPVSALLAVPAAGLAAARPAAPGLSAGPDDLSGLETLRAAEPGAAPVSVAFAIRRGTGGWQRVAIDDSAPYRAFLEPGRFRKGERVQAVAVARGAGGGVARSRVIAVTPNP